MNENDAEQKKQEELQKQIDTVKIFARQYLTREAISRLGNLEAAHPDLALKAAVLISRAAQTGSIREKITDEQFKAILKQIQEPRKEIKIRKV